MKYNGMILVLFFQHVEEAMFGIRNRQKKFANVIDQRSIILDEVFNQMVQINYQISPENPDDELMRYAYGASPPDWGTPWKGAKKLYLPFNVADNHWVAVCVNLEERHLKVFDCSVGATTKANMDKAMKPICKMIPVMLRQSGQFEHIRDHLNAPWPYQRPKEVPQNKR